MILVMPRSCRNIYLAAKYRFYADTPCVFVKVYNAEHTAMISNCHSRLPKLLCPVKSLFYRSLAVKQAERRMCM